MSAVSDDDIEWMITKLRGIGGSSVAAAESAAAMLESLRDERRRSPSYDALLIISQSVAAALERAGVEECDDPGDAIDALAKDAARYRWLRGDSCPDHSKRWTRWEVSCWRAPLWTDDLRRDELDDAIDAEIAGGEG